MNTVRVIEIPRDKVLQSVSIPAGGRILSVVAMQEKIFISVDCDINSFYEDEHYRTAEFAIFNSNQQFHIDGYTYLDTIVLDFGTTIYNVFYRYPNSR